LLKHKGGTMNWHILALTAALILILACIHQYQQIMWKKEADKWLDADYRDMYSKYR